MSHFRVLVVVDEPTEEAITKELAPFHEFECTGCDDEYVKDVDVTADTRAEYESRPPTYTSVPMANRSIPTMIASIANQHQKN